jgi:pyruvate dehydrogenase E1 component alpha subunit
VTEARARAAAGEGPTLIEAITYRIEAHTNADDATRYRAADEVQAWLGRDPISRLERYLADQGDLSAGGIAAIAAEAETFAKSLRERMNLDAELDPAELFAHVYAEPTPALRRQQRLLAAELAAEHDVHPPAGSGNTGDTTDSGEIR